MTAEAHAGRGERPRRTPTRKGGVAIEAALATSGFLALAAAAAFALLAVSAGMRVEQALERTGRILSLLSVAADLAGADRLTGQASDALATRLAALLPQDVPLDVREWLSESSDAVSGAAADGAAEGILGILDGLAVRRLLDGAFERLPDAGAAAGRLIDGNGPGRWDVACEMRLAEDRLRVTVRYGFATPFGVLPRRAALSVPLWISGDGTLDERETRNVWTLGNLARGRALRIRFGANLPLGYPCIAAYREGRATLIHSMDLSPYGWRDAAGAEDEIRSRLRALAAFDGTPAPWGADGIDIPPGAIVERRFLLVVPSNADEARFGPALASAQAEAEALGLRLEVVRYQERPPPVAAE